jgi:isopenicillin-N N-acyltransferase-like protein
VQPLLDLSGTSRERGRAHGEALRGQIERSLDLFGQHTGFSPGSEDLGDRTTYLEAAERWAPGSVEELRGIAQGANRPFAAIFDLNLADERQVFGSAGRCSSLGLRSGAGARPVSGQTMDTPAWFADLRVLLRATQDETELTTLAFTIAGIPALCGVNDAGVAVWCNALYQLAASPTGVPVSCVVSHLLSMRTVGEARTFALNAPHAAGQHYLLCGPDGIVSLECSGASVVEARPSGNPVWHTNHPIAGEGAVGSAVDENSLARDAFIADSLSRASGSPAELCRILEDRSVPVCKVGGEGGDGYTLWAVVVEHGSPLTVLASAGPPAPGAWVPVGLTHVQR